MSIKHERDKIGDYSRRYDNRRYKPSGHNSSSYPEPRKLELHAAHAAAWHRRSALVLFRHFGDHGLGGDQQTGNRRRTLDRRAHDLGRVDNAFGDEIAVFAGLRVEAVGVLVLVHDLADNDRAIGACIGRDLTGRRLDRLAHDVDAVLLVLVLSLDALECLD